jgi:enolase
MSAAIVNIRARQVLDSRGRPTLEVDVRLASGERGSAIAPAGASTGASESRERRDNDRRFRGLGVRSAVRDVHGEVADALRGHDATDQRAIDRMLVDLDATPDRHRLGANTLLAVSLACAHAAAAHEHTSLWRRLAPERAHLLPVPMLTVFDGGAHARNSADPQEVMVVPWAAESFADALHVGVQVFWSLGDVLTEQGLATTVGHTGGFAPGLRSIEAALALAEAAIERAGHRPGHDVALAIDAAASQWRSKDGDYRLAEEGVTVSSAELVDYWAELVSRHPVVSLEDPLGEDDPDGWAELTRRCGDRVQVVGDDLLVTDAERVRDAAAHRLANAAVIKPNQIGTLSEALDAVGAAREVGWGVIVSSRTGDSEDTTIADLAVGVQAGQIKAGGPSRGERVAKFNRLIRIEEEIGDDALFVGREPFRWRTGAGSR